MHPREYGGRDRIRSNYSYESCERLGQGMDVLRKALEEELEELRASKMFPSMGCDGMPHGSGGGDMSDYIIKLDTVMSKLIKARYDRIESYSDIFTDIERMEDEQEKEMLSYRYLKGYNWEKICDEKGYGWAQMHRIHARALKNFKIGKHEIE